MPQPITRLLQHANKLIDSKESQILLAHVLKKPKEYIIAHPETKVGFFNSFKYKKLVKKRKKGWPIAYLTGHKEFFGLDFLVNKYTLVPRPDTEILVESVIEKIQNNDVIIDVGTGSGCIPIAILKNCQKIKGVATDISQKTLKVAKENAKKHEVEISFLHGNLLEPVIEKIPKEKNIIITANLPYLTETQFETEKSIQHEPKSALVAEDNGLKLYKELIRQIQLLEGKNITAFFEIDPSQSTSLNEYVLGIFPNAVVEIKKDLANCDRIVIVQIQ